MTNQFFCKNRDRWKKIKESNSINGIDYLEIFSASQTVLKIYFLNNLPGQLNGVPSNTVGPPPQDHILTKDNIFIQGGVRIMNISVQSISADENVLTVIVDKPGDFSSYVLKIGNSITDQDTPPDGFDMQLSAIEFSFKINCLTEFDCKTDTGCTPVNPEEPDISYLAKDYSSFNRLMLDRLSIIMPDWKERNAADLQVALIEMLAYMGDHLSYYQDAVATEAYLETARRRISLKRHARLLDYYVHDGCNARVWIYIEVEKAGNADGATIGQGTMLTTNGMDGIASLSNQDKEKFLAQRDPVVFETMHLLTLNSAHNRVSFYTWEDTDCCLPAGSTRATLIDDPALSFATGDVLVFEELYGPVTGWKADADPEHRHAVRLKRVTHGVDSLTGTGIVNIEWYEKDALPFPLCLTSPVKNEDNELQVNEKSIVRGNIVLADHGMTQTTKKLLPDTVPAQENYYPQLPEKDITVTMAYDNEVEKNNGAGFTIVQDPHKALPSVSLVEGSLETWTAQKDLLGSDRFATGFVVETEQDGVSFLRFGDNILGKQPLSGSQPGAIYRIGNGKKGNIGPEAINTIEWEGGGILKVRNPLPASGAMNPETMEEVRQFAPQAFRTQERAVTETDYIEKTELHPEVQKAAAKFYWTGSWYTVYIMIDRKAGKELDELFKTEIRRHLEQYRMAGYDLEIRAPRFVPLSIVLNVCVQQEYFSSNVKQALLKVFSNYELGDGTRGFFHPDNFTFGQAVYLSLIYQAAMQVEGVASVEIKELKRLGKNSDGEIDKGLLQPAELEILRLDNSPNFPENGKINFIMLGGL